MKAIRQKGNVLFLVLIAIVLFAALTYSFSRSSRMSGKISYEDAQLAAQNILSFAEKANSAVQRISLQNSCLVSQLSFENTVVAGYTNAAAPANKKCHVFDPAGGGITLDTPPSNALDTASATVSAGVPYAAGGLIGNYFFAGNICADGQGTGALATCASDGTSNEELMLILPWVNVTVCGVLNTILGNSAAMLQDPSGSFDATKFTGTFADGYALGQGGFTTYATGCYQSLAGATPGTGYHFYYVLMAR